MSQTVVVGIRLDPEDAERFRDQARRFGLTPSKAGAALIEEAVAYERQTHEESDAQH